LSEQTDYQKILYQCNQCGKKRIAEFPMTLKFQIDYRGLGNFVDVHSCKDGKVNGNILFVDYQNSVRSQEPIGGEGDDDFKEDEFTELSIPSPETTELKTSLIKAPRDFQALKLKNLNIKDRLRRLNFQLENGQKSDSNLSVVSKMKFIEISVDLSDSLELSEAQEWFQNIADLLDCVIQLNDNVLTYLVLFLEERLEHKPEEADKKFLDLLLNSPLTLPITNKKSIDFFMEQKEQLFSQINQDDYHCYNCILESSLDNYSKTLLVVYDELCHQMKISHFLQSIYELSSHALVNLLKLEFHDIQ
jgi:hypothetical protein